jgi:hypothetical protein
MISVQRVRGEINRVCRVPVGCNLVNVAVKPERYLLKLL